MNSFEQTILTKAGHDNGWEVVVSSDETKVILASSVHPGQAIITMNSGLSEKYQLELTENIEKSELSRDMPPEIFKADGSIRVWDESVLGLVLRRAAELLISLPEQPLADFQNELENALSNNPEIKGTEKERLVKQRIGQDVFRRALLRYWKGCCAVSTISLPELLRASHIKPWAECANDSERLNVYNGFLLSANLDALFDTGLISFDNTGKIIISKTIPESEYKIIGINKDTRLRWIDEKHFPFLAWHREKVFGGKE